MPGETTGHMQLNPRHTSLSTAANANPLARPRPTRFGEQAQAPARFGGQTQPAARFGEQPQAEMLPAEAEFEPDSQAEFPVANAFGALQRPSQGAFANFTQYTRPTPVGSRLSFYRDEILRNRQQGPAEANKLYYENLKKNRLKGLAVGAGIVGMSLMLTGARGDFRKLLHVAFLGTLLPLPIIKANQVMPKLDQAYEKAKQGNPSEAERLFSQGYREFRYSVLQNFLKPVSLAFTLTTFLSLPQCYKAFKPFMQKTPKHWIGGTMHGVKNVINVARGWFNKPPIPTANPDFGFVVRGVTESILCRILDTLNKLSFKSGSLCTDVSRLLEGKLGWKAAHQPVSLLFKLNEILVRWGGRFEHSVHTRAGFVKKLMPVPPKPIQEALDYKLPT